MASSHPQGTINPDKWIGYVILLNSDQRQWDVDWCLGMSGALRLLLTIDHLHAHFYSHAP